MHRILKRKGPQGTEPPHETIRPRMGPQLPEAKVSEDVKLDMSEVFETLQAQYALFQAEQKERERGGFAIVASAGPCHERCPSTPVDDRDDLDALSTSSHQCSTGPSTPKHNMSGATSRIVINDESPMLGYARRTVRSGTPCHGRCTGGIDHASPTTLIARNTTLQKGLREPEQSCKDMQLDSTADHVKVWDEYRASRILDGTGMSRKMLALFESQMTLSTVHDEVQDEDAENLEIETAPADYTAKRLDSPFQKKLGRQRERPISSEVASMNLLATRLLKPMPAPTVLPHSLQDSRRWKRDETSRSISAHASSSARRSRSDDHHAVVSAPHLLTSTYDLDKTVPILHCASELSPNERSQANTRRRPRSRPKGARAKPAAEKARTVQSPEGLASMSGPDDRPKPSSPLQRIKTLVHAGVPCISPEKNASCVATRAPEPLGRPAFSLTAKHDGDGRHKLDKEQGPEPDSAPETEPRELQTDSVAFTTAIIPSRTSSRSSKSAKGSSKTHAVPAQVENVATSPDLMPPKTPSGDGQSREMPAIIDVEVYAPDEGVQEIEDHSIRFDRYQSGDSVLERGSWIGAGKEPIRPAVSPEASSRSTRTTREWQAETQAPRSRSPESTANPNRPSSDDSFNNLIDAFLKDLRRQTSRASVGSAFVEDLVANGRRLSEYTSHLQHQQAVDGTNDEAVRGLRQSAGLKTFARDRFAGSADANLAKMSYFGPRDRVSFQATEV